jgi:hypothetical protein
MALGKIRFQSGVVAVLDDDGHWSCPDEAYELLLNDAYDPRRVELSILPFGSMAVDLAAHDLHAEVLLAPEVPPVPKGAVS